mmetsp:Transcript_100185/g.323173  ORF Transcript_100185/g.323173 Transcript_100185/m.323173 type:complete len:207 (+) Transcript_100185:1939-2559(+)
MPAGAWATCVARAPCCARCGSTAWAWSPRCTATSSASSLRPCGCQRPRRPSACRACGAPGRSSRRRAVAAPASTGRGCSTRSWPSTWPEAFPALQWTCSSSTRSSARGRMPRPIASSWRCLAAGRGTWGASSRSGRPCHASRSRRRSSTTSRWRWRWRRAPPGAPAPCSRSCSPRGSARRRSSRSAWAGRGATSCRSTSSWPGSSR